MTIKRLVSCLALALIWNALPASAQVAQTEPEEILLEEPEISIETEVPVESIEDELPLEESPFNAPFSQQNFVPDISLIVDFSAGWRSLSNTAYSEKLGQTHHTPNLNSGFNLNYAELTFSAPVDPYFELLSTFHLNAFEIEIEEAYFNSRGLPWNLQVKGGKFLSHFGRLNAQHAHFWAFDDAPLAYRTLLGTEHLNELGLRLSMLLPVDFYLDAGLEILQGTNATSFGTQGFHVGDQRLSDVIGPNLWVSTLKSSWDINDEWVLLGGLSYAQGGARLHTGTSAADAHVHQLSQNTVPFAGFSQVWGADFQVRWLQDSYRDLSWQSEWLWRQLTGSEYTANGRQSVSALQQGGYSELMWRFAQLWRTGLRADYLSPSYADDSWQQRYQALIEHHPSEFSRVRLSYSLHPDTVPIHALFLNLNLAMGAHGAHHF